jgi:hypothetical protein
VGLTPTLDAQHVESALQSGSCDVSVAFVRWYRARSILLVPVSRAAGDATHPLPMKLMKLTFML